MSLSCSIAFSLDSWDLNPRKTFCNVNEKFSIFSITYWELMIAFIRQIYKENFKFPNKNGDSTYIMSSLHILIGYIVTTAA